MELNFDSDAQLDHQLMARIAQQDHEAFRQLIEIHQNGVLHLTTAMLGNRHDAEDIAQQVFLRIWKYAKSYQPNSLFKSYLYTIAKRLVYNESRKRIRKSETSLDNSTDKHLQDFADEPQSCPDAKLLQQELQRAVDEAIQSLPEIQRLAIIFRRYDKMPYEKIAGILDISLSSLKSHLFRARTSLREKLSPLLGRLKLDGSSPT